MEKMLAPLLISRKKLGTEISCLLCVGGRSSPGRPYFDDLNAVLTLGRHLDAKSTARAFRAGRGTDPKNNRCARLEHELDRRTDEPVIPFAPACHAAEQFPVVGIDRPAGDPLSHGIADVLPGMVQGLPASSEGAVRFSGGRNHEGEQYNGSNGTGHTRATVLIWRAGIEPSRREMKFDAWWLLWLWLKEQKPRRRRLVEDLFVGNGIRYTPTVL